MDTDGSVTAYGRCEFTSMKKQLAEGVYSLVVSLGMQAKLITGEATIAGVNKGVKYRVTFTPHSLTVFRLERKVKRLRLGSAVQQRDRVKQRFIVSCIPVDSVPVQCIQVDSPSHQYLAGRSFIPTHNSLLWNEILLHAAECGERCCIASFEMAPKKTLTRAVKQATAMHTPGKDAIEGCLDFMSDRLWIYNKVGTGKVKEMLEVFEYAYRRHGVKQFLIDSLMKCGIAEDDYREQKAFIEVLCDFAIRTDSHIHLIAHPRKGDDEMSPAKKLDIRGTGAISDLAFNTMSVWRNKKKESLLAAYQEGEPLPGNMTLDSLEAQADAYLFIDKCREDGTWEGRYPLWFHPGCLRYTRKRSEHPKAYYSTKGMQMAQDDPFAGGGEPW